MSRRATNEPRVWEIDCCWFVELHGRQLDQRQCISVLTGSGVDQRTLTWLRKGRQGLYRIGLTIVTRWRMETGEHSPGLPGWEEDAACGNSFEIHRSCPRGGAGLQQEPRRVHGRQGWKIEVNQDRKRQSSTHRALCLGTLLTTDNTMEELSRTRPAVDLAISP